MVQMPVLNPLVRACADPSSMLEPKTRTIPNQPASGRRRLGFLIHWSQVPLRSSPPPAPAVLGASCSSTLGHQPRLRPFPTLPLPARILPGVLLISGVLTGHIGCSLFRTHG